MLKLHFEAIFKRCELEKLLHKLVGINAAAQVYRQLEAAEVYLIAEVRYFFELALLKQLCDLVKDEFDRG